MSFMGHWEGSDHVVEDTLMNSKGGDKVLCIGWPNQAAYIWKDNCHSSDGMHTIYERDG